MPAVCACTSICCSVNKLLAETVFDAWLSGIQHNTASAHQDDSSDESDESDNIVGEQCQGMSTYSQLHSYTADQASHSLIPRCLGVAPSFEIADTDDGVVVTVDLPGIESVVGVGL